MIDVTEKAKDYLLDATNSHGQKYATFSVKGGGCSGFTYDWQFANEITNPEEWIEVQLSDNSDNKLMINRLAEMYILGSGYYLFDFSSGLAIGHFGSSSSGISTR